jgi:IclR family transcriptional regulator, KDG regulon repressor
MAETSKTVDQALVLLKAIAAGGSGSTSELARRTGLNRTVAHRLLATLDRHGFVRRYGDRWELGVALLGLGQQVEPELRQVARPLLVELVADVGETAVLSVPETDQAVVLDQVVAPGHLVRAEYPPGFRHPLALGAHGRAILAYSEPSLVERVLSGVDEPGALDEELTAIRARGYATSHDELRSGAWGLAVPVLGADDRVMGSIGVVMPVGRRPDERRLATTIVATARRAGAGLRGASAASSGGVARARALVAERAPPR